MGEPLPPFETRYSGILESIIESVKLKAFLQKLDLTQIAVNYYVQLAKSQAFMNGNKRMSVVLSDVFLRLNGFELKKKYVDLENLTLMLSEDHQHDLEQIIKILTPIFKKMIKKKLKSKSASKPAL